MGFVVVMLAMYLLLFVAGGGFLLCWIIVLRRIFKHEGKRAGIISIIIPLIAWYEGWKRAAEWKTRGLMVFWTLLWCPVVVVLVIVIASVADRLKGL